jgi:hypothetical protein
VQGVRVDRDAALPLAVLVLPQPRPGPGPRLDERALPALRGRPRDRRHHAGLLVPGAGATQAAHRSAGLRRRRQPRSATTAGKDAARAKAIELAGWPYPRHLAGRSFGVVVHGDAAGAETLRRNLTDWLTEMSLEPAGGSALLDRYIGYLEPYATSHDALDRDDDLFTEVDNVATTVVEHVRQRRAGGLPADRDLANPRPK